MVKKGIWITLQIKPSLRMLATPYRYGVSGKRGRKMLRQDPAGGKSGGAKTGHADRRSEAGGRVKKIRESESLNEFATEVL